MPYTTQYVGTYRQFWQDEPDDTDAAPIWFHRTQNSVIAYLEGPQGSAFARADNPDEYFVWALFHGVRIQAGDEAVDVPAGSVVIVPPGPSTVQLSEPGSVWLGFTALATDLVDKAPNRTEYEPPLPNVAPIVQWPEPAGGYRLRVYDLDAHPAGQAQCYVHRTAMSRFRWPYRSEPRNPRAMSPHHHEDFEQASLIVAGTMVHHVRRDWSRNSEEWLADDHYVITAPAVAISKPPDTHTTQAMTRGAPVGLIDYFAPPRWDFASTPGMVTNQDEYPPLGEKPAFHVEKASVYASDDPRRAIETPRA